VTTLTADVSSPHGAAKTDRNYERNPYVQALSLRNIGWAVNEGILIGVFEPASASSVVRVLSQGLRQFFPALVLQRQYS
jgi:hypothetical protein